MDNLRVDVLAAVVEDGHPLVGERGVLFEERRAPRHGVRLAVGGAIQHVPGNMGRERERERKADRQ